MDDIINIKVILLGEMGTGKTSLINVYFGKEFDNNTFTFTTSAPEFYQKQLTIKGINCTVGVWDTAGQEKYRALNQIFYKDASICILVFDVTNSESFKALQEYWYQQVKDSAPKNIVIGLAANKCDLIENEQVSEEKARTFAKEMNAFFESTSAAKNIGIEDLFHKLGRKYIDPNYKIDEDEKNPNNDMKDKSENKAEHKKSDKKLKLDAKKNAKDEGKKKKKFC